MVSELISAVGVVIDRERPDTVASLVAGPGTAPKALIERGVRYEAGGCLSFRVPRTGPTLGVV